MNSKIISQQPAYILHYSEFRESSLILDVFTLNHGCISMVARGARRAKPATRALYQPFRPLLLSWIGTDGLRTLSGIEPSGKCVQITDTQLACGYYFNELLLKLLGKEQVQTQIFAHYSLALAELADPAIPIETVLRAFELQVLDILGVLPNFTCCTVDNSVIEIDRDYLFHPANAIAVPVANSTVHGYLKQKSSGDEGSGHSPSIHPDGATLDQGIKISGKSLIAMSELDFSDPQTLSDARRVMRKIIQLQIGNQPLKSRDLFQAFNPASRTSEPQGPDLGK
jgi:DNA repair protein RecO (recombination protein O)